MQSARHDVPGTAEQAAGMCRSTWKNVAGSVCAAGRSIAGLWSKKEAKKTQNNSNKSIMKFFKQSETYISERMKLYGNIETDANVSIDGEMHGNMLANSHVMLGSTAYFEGNIECETALICGRFKGTVVARKLIEVKIPAVIVGDLISDSVKVESGVAIQGKICAKKAQDCLLSATTVTAAEGFSETAEVAAQE